MATPPISNHWIYRKFNISYLVVLRLCGRGTGTKPIGLKPIDDGERPTRRRSRRSEVSAGEDHHTPAAPARAMN